jgi:hypothetical protein
MGSDSDKVSPAPSASSGAWAWVLAWGLVWGGALEGVVGAAESLLLVVFVLKLAVDPVLD